jgi:hypothetical protein
MFEVSVQPIVSDTGSGQKKRVEVASGVEPE